MFTSYFNENKCNGESLLSLSDNVYCPNKIVVSLDIIFQNLFKQTNKAGFCPFDHVGSCFKQLNPFELAKKKIRGLITQSERYNGSIWTFTPKAMQLQGFYWLKPKLKVKSRVFYW